MGHKPSSYLQCQVSFPSRTTRGVRAGPGVDWAGLVLRPQRGGAEENLERLGGTRLERGGTFGVLREGGHQCPQRLVASGYALTVASLVLRTFSQVLPPEVVSIPDLHRPIRACGPGQTCTPQPAKPEGQAVCTTPHEAHDTAAAFCGALPASLNRFTDPPKWPGPLPASLGGLPGAGLKPRRNRELGALIGGN